MFFTIGLMLLIGGTKGDEELIPMEGTMLTFTGEVFNASEYWDPRRVIDGNDCGKADACHCCTAIMRPATITIDLKQPYPLGRIKIYGRTDKDTFQSGNIELCVGLFPDNQCNILRPTHLEHVFNPAMLVQFIIVSASDTLEFMTICEIKVFRKNVVNLFKSHDLKVSVNQTGTYNQCSAEKSLDRKYSTSYANDAELCAQCSATNNTEAGWEADFGQLVQGQFISIIGRLGSSQDQSEDLLVYTSDSPQTNNNQTLVLTVKDWKSELGKLHYIGNRTFRYLTIRRWFIRVLTLCEVMVFMQECDSGAYGSSCKQCGHCNNDSVCDRSTGHCPSGCEPGWQLDKCDKECEDGQYGLNCTHECNQNCINTSQCNKENGACIGGCLPGYDFNMNSTCNTECGDGMFGLKCEHNCSLGCLRSCNKGDGTCIGGCLPGYAFAKNNTCNTECEGGHYGWNCTQTCSERCTNSSLCNKKNGACIGGCRPGYDFNKNASCSLECEDGQYGLNCTLECNQNCINTSQCNKENGACIGACLPGYDFNINSTCNTECGDGMFGLNCEHNCNPACLRSCNKGDGTCIGGCFPGYAFAKNNTCNTVCEDGQYGLNCTHECNQNCINTSQCNKENGACIGGCLPGYDFNMNSTCNTECKPGFYGENCSMECHCQNCHNVNGTCALLSSQCHGGFHFDKGMCKVDVVESTSAAAIGGGVGAAIVVIVAVAAGIVFLRRRTIFKRHEDKHDNTEMTELSRKKSHVSTAHDSEVYSDAGNKVYENLGSDYYSFKSLIPGIKNHLLWDYIRDKTKSGPSFFADEFAKLPTGLIHKHEVAASIENRGKNRYREMFAYDHSRVPLAKDKPTDSEYINACYIHGFEKENKFIASQGPTEKIIVDFWRMVCQQRVEKIVMLTNLVESGTSKCLQYWPEEINSVSTFGDVNVKCIGIEKMYDYNIRTLDIAKVCKYLFCNFCFDVISIVITFISTYAVAVYMFNMLIVFNSEGKETRRVKQFHLKTWPDKDVPDTTWCLFDFWRAVDTNHLTNTSPIVVHCSAGVGRTGTFIALDNLITQGRMEGSVRPLPMVEALRQQRVNMVQTKDQYLYLHEALADALLMGTHHVLTMQFESVYNYMMGKENGSNTTRLDEQFELIVRSVEEAAMPAEEQASSGPMYGNMDTVMSEIDAYRPQMQKRGSTSIQQLGAIYLPTFGNKNALLVCMSPTEQHLEEFWSLVEEQHVTTVINLSTPDTATYEICQYLGGRGNRRVGRFSVNYIHEKKYNGSVERSFSFRDENHEDEDYLTTIKQFQLTSWMEGHDTPTDMQSFLDMIEKILKWQSHLTDNRPILIHCQTGFIRCGLMAVVLNEIQRIRKESGQINIVESVKTMKTRCRDVVHNKAQYRFCYEAILTYVKITGTYQNI